jgi:hypothetical protein
MCSLCPHLCYRMIDTVFMHIGVKWFVVAHKILILFKLIITSCPFQYFLSIIIVFCLCMYLHAYSNIYTYVYTLLK